jgi:hypothetical protein
MDQVPLDEHAKDVFQALIQLSKDRSDNFYQFLTFIWLRCHRKIKDRLAADEAMLGMPLLKLLETWQLAPHEEVTYEWFPINSHMHSKFVAAGVPFRTHTDETGKSA